MENGLTRITNNELEKFRLNLSRYTNLDVTKRKVESRNSNILFLQHLQSNLLPVLYSRPKRFFHWVSIVRFQRVFIELAAILKISFFPSSFRADKTPSLPSAALVIG